MATIINNPGNTSSDSTTSGLGSLLSAILLLIIVVLVLVYGLPVLRGLIRGASSSGVQVTVPDKINVNVNKTQ